MTRPSLAVAPLLIALAAPAFAQKIPPEFRSAFEGKVRRGLYAVVMQKGVPTTSIYGVNGQQTDAYYSVDVKGERWQTSQGFLDLNQVAVDSLNEGEVMEVTDVTFKDKDNRIDLRMVSLEAHKVTRGEGFGKTTKREPVSTNFKFFFPFPLRAAQDVPQALKYLDSCLKIFPSEDAARAYSGQLLAKGAGGTRAASAPGGTPVPPPSGSSKKEIKVGMTPLEVLDILGKPRKEVSFENQSKWTYPDLTVIFENGRVKEVRF